MQAPFGSQAISLFGWTWGHFPVPATYHVGATRSGGPGWRKAPAPWRLALDGREARAKLPFCRRRASCLVAAGVVLAAGSADLGHAQAPSGGAPPAFNPAVAGRPDFRAIEAAIAEASQRFGLPPTWIRTVMQAESGFEPRAISRAGAMGLMQLMPQTWAEWRNRLGLGGDPFDVRDNILAGAAYLRALFDRFGAPGFLAAYNAGPGRYLDHLAGARPLPAETQIYVSKVAPRLLTIRPTPAAPRGAGWQRAGLFATTPAAPRTTRTDALFVRSSAADAGQ